MIVVVEGICRLGGSPFLEVLFFLPTTGSLPLMKRDPAVRLIKECSIGMSPGQELIVLRIKQQTRDFWNQQKQPHIDYQAQLKSTKSEHRK